MRISDWSSDVCSSDLFKVQEVLKVPTLTHMPGAHPQVRGVLNLRGRVVPVIDLRRAIGLSDDDNASPPAHLVVAEFNRSVQAFLVSQRSEEHTSELQSLMRISYAVFCLKKKTKQKKR